MDVNKGFILASSFFFGLLIGIYVVVRMRRHDKEKHEKRLREIKGGNIQHDVPPSTRLPFRDERK